MPSWGWFALWAVLMAFGTWVVWDGRKSVRDIRAAGDPAVATIQAAAETPVLDDAAVAVLVAAGTWRDALGPTPATVDMLGLADEAHDLSVAVDEWRASRG